MPQSQSHARSSQHHASSRSRSESRRDSEQAREEVLGLLIEDHKRMKKVFRAFERMDREARPDEAQALVRATCVALMIHASLEEEVFYPAARECIDEESLIEEAEVEHASARSLIEQLLQLDPQDPKYAASFTVLGEYTLHHIKEEEKEIFPQLSRTDMDWPALVQAMHERRQELLQQYRLAGEDTGQAQEDDEGDEEAAEAERQRDA